MVGFLPKCKGLKVALIQMPEAGSDSKWDWKRVSLGPLGVYTMPWTNQIRRSSFVKGQLQRVWLNNG